MAHCWQFTCELPLTDWLGTAFEVQLQRAWVALPAGVGFPPPVVLSISPHQLPNTGGTVAIQGLHFGWQSCTKQRQRSDVVTYVTIAPYQAPSPVPCTIVEWTSTQITCTTVGGFDAAVRVTVWAGGQVC